MIKLSDEEAKKLLFFQQATGAAARDSVEVDGQVIFVVAKGEIGKAIGKQGKNIEILEKLLKKKIIVVEHSDDIKKFAENIFFPIKIDIENHDRGITIKVDKKEKKYVIGKGGRKIKIARVLLKRHFDIDNIRVI